LPNQRVHLPSLRDAGDAQTVMWENHDHTEQNHLLLQAPKIPICFAIYQYGARQMIQVRHAFGSFSQNIVVVSLLFSFFGALSSQGHADEASNTNKIMEDPVQDSEDTSVSIQPIPQPAPDQNQFIGFEIRVSWMTGHIRVRLPENIDSNLGRHFLDALQPEVKRISTIEYPRWTVDTETGGIRYSVHTDEGVQFGGKVWLRKDVVEMEFIVLNDTGQAQNFNGQVCIDMSPSHELSVRNTLATTYAWLDGTYRCLKDATPMPNTTTLENVETFWQLR